jgi:hypothetical protein
MTMSGDDLGFAPILTACFVTNCAKGTLPVAEAALPALKLHMINVYKAVKAASSGAKVLVEGYPSIFSASLGTDQVRCPWLNPTEQLGLVKLAKDLDSTLKAAAAAAGVQYVSLLNTLAGHELCTAQPWMNTITLNTSNNGRGHPTGYGQKAMATTVTSYVRLHGLL